MEREGGFNPEQHEAGEDFSQNNEVVLDLIRHGSSQYLENQHTEEERAQMGDDRPLDLTDAGVQEVKLSVEKIVGEVDPDNEIIVTWSSSAWRAKDTMSLVKSALEEREIEPHKESVIPTIRNFDQHDTEYLNNFWKKLAEEGRSPELAYPLDEQFQVEDPRFESYPHTQHRAERMMNWVRFLAENSNIPEGKKLHIIGVSHSEIINPIIENIFGFKPEDERGIKKGESMRLDFNYDKKDQLMKISADLRDQHKENLQFDTSTRKFIEADE